MVDNQLAKPDNTKPAPLPEKPSVTKPTTNKSPSKNTSNSKPNTPKPTSNPSTPKAVSKPNSQQNTPSKPASTPVKPTLNTPTKKEEEPQANHSSPDKKPDSTPQKVEKTEEIAQPQLDIKEVKAVEDPKTTEVKHHENEEKHASHPDIPEKVEHNNNNKPPEEEAIKIDKEAKPELAEQKTTPRKEVRILKLNDAYYNSQLD